MARLHRGMAAAIEPLTRGRFLSGETAMSNMNDAMGLCVRYGKVGSQYETEFEPATGTVWGYFNPKDGTPCYSLGLLKDILEHDQKLVADGCQVELDGMRHSVNYYVTGSRTRRLFNLAGRLPRV